MATKGEWIRYGDEVGYFAVPERAKGPLPSVVVIQEIGGVNRNIEDIARRIAASGYAALAPDIYATRGERPEPLRRERVEEAFAFMATMPPASRFDPAVRDAALSALPADARARISESFERIFSMMKLMPTFVPALREAVRYLREDRPESKGQKVGCVGFCMGGGLSTLLACEEPELSAAATFYGSAPPAEKVRAIRCPVIGFFGEKDERVNAGIPGFEAALREAGRSFEYRIYPGANHAFFNDDGPSYDPAASRDAFARLLSFFSANLAT
jgi:carboxymethylenebutenolidase